MTAACPYAQAERPPPAPVPPERDLPLLELIGRLRTNALAAWPRRAYEDLLLHRRCLGVDTYLVNDPREARAVLAADVDDYERPLGFRRLYQPIFGGGLLLAEGCEWRRRRKRLAPGLTPRSVRGMIPRFRAVAKRLCDRLVDGEPANLSRMFQDAAIDAVGRAAFSMSLDRLRDEISEFRSEYFTRGAKVSILDHLATRESDFFLDRGVRGHRGRLGRSIVARLLLARDADRERSDDPDLVDLIRRDSTADQSEQIDEMATLLGTGFDTSGRAMFWSAYLLSRRPDLQARIRAEVLAYPPERVTDLNDLDHWPWLRRCVLEALRLYPPLQSMMRVPRRDVVICGREVRAGSYVAISPWVMHRHRRLWDEPEHFRPERFGPDLATALRTPAFMPFGAGRRLCIGSTFALTEVTLVLAEMFGRFRVSLPENAPVTPMSVVTTAPDREPLFRIDPG
ncbi:cytochrome P450 [Brevundimonas sp.]|uniref:cytochrome P450 n=1 Tax=Brevundimonas sp. TaxID=1871086 RepID=UPI0025FC8D38|nr:cytochrome P450 [Brevundimonas sp.]